MQKIKLTATLALLCLAWGCKEKDNYPHITVNAGLAAYFDYTVGSYWIFKDAQTSEIDTFTVTINRTGSTSLEAAKKLGYHIDDKLITLWQKKKEVTWQLSMRDSSAGYFYFNGGASGNLNICKTYPFDTSTKNGVPSTIQHLSSWTFNTINTTDVYKARSIYNNLTDTIYFNKSIGLLEINLNNIVQKHDWVLISYHLN